MEHIVNIIETGFVTPDVKYFRVERPEGYTFIPGQATDVSINTPELKGELRPFTFTNLTTSHYLEFMIKRYPEHKGITDAIHNLKRNDELILHDVFGELHFKKPGIFIAGGAGITPFISIFRDLKTKNMLNGNSLIFANKTRNDIILEKELRDLLGRNFTNILSNEKMTDYAFGFITEDFLKTSISGFDEQFYVCGPPPMMESVLGLLGHLGVGKDSILIEPM